MASINDVPQELNDYIIGLLGQSEDHGNRERRDSLRHLSLVARRWVHAATLALNEYVQLNDNDSLERYMASLDARARRTHDTSRIGTLYLGGLNGDQL